MTTQVFLQELDVRIAKYDLLCHPFYKTWAAGQLSRRDLQAYGREYFHHVEAFPAYLSEFASRLPQGSLRKAALANRDDEMGANGERSHADLWLDFVEGMGGERSVDAQPRTPQLAELIDSFHSVARNGFPEEALAAFYAYESQVPRVAGEKARGLREMYGADEKACQYFTLHTTADVYHSRVWSSQLEQAVEGDCAAAARALAAGENAAKALWNALDGIEAARVARAA
ncbi:MAG TPA: iron-containing redox enzyme family protein [Terriglobales bacterium]|nr:iron-containing redox enzyme family protein [Terriglobia bacterium]